jgi:hypothetical protein
MDGGWRSRDRGMSAAAGLCLVGLASVVAMTSRATAHGTGGLLRAGSSGSHAVGTVLLTTGFVLWLGATGVLAAALWPAAIRRRKRNPEDDAFEPYRPEVYWWERAIVLALPLALFVGVLAAVVLFGRGGGTAAPTTTFTTGVGSVPGPRTTSTVPAPTTAPASSGSTFGVALIVAAAVVLVAGMVLVVVWRRSRPETTSLRPGREREIAETLESSLDDLRREPDPRRAVVAAYARMERLLGEHGVRRHRWEAPLEYLRRALAGLRGGESSIQELTSLFHEARFSPHTVGEPERARAVEVLTTLRQELDDE